MELPELKGKDFGIEETKAQEIRNQFKPMLDKMVEFEEEYNKIIKLPRGKVETEQKARELRLKLVKVRTGTAEIHKVQKAFYLAGGRFVDAWKNAQLFASQGLEEKLLDIETFRQRQEAERVEKLNKSRAEKIAPYVDEIDINGLNFGAMQDDVWEAYFLKKKKDFEDLEEAKKIAEREREKERLLDEREGHRRGEIQKFQHLLGNDVLGSIRNMTEEDFDSMKTEMLEKLEEINRKKDLKNQREEALRDYGRYVDWSLDFGEVSQEEYDRIFNEAKTKMDAMVEEARKANERAAKVSERTKRLGRFSLFVKEIEKVGDMSDEEFEKTLEDAQKAFAKEEKKKEAERLKREREQAKLERDRVKVEKAKEKERSEKLKDFDGFYDPDTVELGKMSEAAFVRLLNEAKEKKNTFLKKEGYKARLKDWVARFEEPEMDEDKFGEGQDLAIEIAYKFEKFKQWANAQIEKD